MKIKTDIRLFAALGILAVLAIVPLSSSVFAQSNSGDNDDSNNDNGDKRKLQKELKKEKLREIKNIALESRIEAKSKIFDEIKHMNQTENLIFLLGVKQVVGQSLVILLINHQSRFQVMPSKQVKECGRFLQLEISL